ncbi:histidine phosphatase family protein [Rhabdothermincola salaria]|uniref:histidine phosphatase family protein n=1 Tax=Rhabdothermincola salaria TaxID=2903142 RepID=UPI001E583B7C|nr:histidine phosphatase family protein [Rhabdothermincola salaria]MCD9625365.1 histidine phosphatase family protein [Rhabdothermincola salaria]
MTQMLLVRHGQSEWNALGRWQGRADPPLTDLGRQQAFHASARIGSVDVVCASPLQRALDTARIISEQIGVGPVVVEADLAERDAGQWQGLTRAEIEDGWPGFLDTGRRPEGYEDQDTLVVRVHGALGRIAAEYEGAEVLVLTHGGVINAVEHDSGLPWERMPNLGGRWVTHHGDRLTVGDRLVLVDDDELTVPSQI